MAIHCITGTVGSGKTVYAVSLMIAALREGHLVSSNIALKNLSKYDMRNYLLMSDDELQDYGRWRVGSARGSGGDLRYLIFIDEASEWFDSVGANNEDVEKLVSWLRHSDKQGCDVYLITQHIMMLHRRLRMLVASYFVGRNLAEWVIPGLGFKLPGMRGYSFFSQLDRDGRTSLAKPVIFYRPPYYRHYDTASGHGATVGILLRGRRRVRDRGIVGSLLL